MFKNETSLTASLFYELYFTKSEKKSLIYNINKSKFIIWTLIKYSMYTLH